MQLDKKEGKYDMGILGEDPTTARGDGSCVRHCAVTFIPQKREVKLLVKQACSLQFTYGSGSTIRPPSWGL